MLSPEAKGREIVRERAGGLCEGAIAGICLGKHETTHHRLKRGQGGTWAPSNLLGLCGDGTRGCHGLIEAHPSWANDRGLWIMAGDGDPDQVAVFMRWTQTAYLGWWVLDDEGMLEGDGGEFEPVQHHPMVRDFLSPSAAFAHLHHA